MDLANSNVEKTYEYIHDNLVKKTCYLMNHYCYQYFWSHEHLCKRLEFLNEKKIALRIQYNLMKLIIHRDALLCHPCKAYIPSVPTVENKTSVLSLNIGGTCAINIWLVPHLRTRIGSNNAALFACG